MTSDKRYEIALGTVADIGDIVHFQVAMALESEGTVLNTERVTAGVTAAINDPNRGFYIVAKLDGNTVGSLMVTKEWSDWNNQWYWWVQSVYVTPEHRKSGVFRALYESVKERAAAISPSFVLSLVFGLLGSSPPRVFQVYFTVISLSLVLVTLAVFVDKIWLFM